MDFNKSTGGMILGLILGIFIYKAVIPSEQIGGNGEWIIDTASQIVIERRFIIFGPALLGAVVGAIPTKKASQE